MMADKGDAALAGNVLRMMGERGWTNAEVARRSGLKPGHVSMILNRKVGVTLRTLRMLRDGFGCSWDELLG